MTSKIEMTKTEAIAAGRLSSDKFNELKTLREMFPAFQIEIVKIVTKKVDHFKGLTYEYMENYIKDNKESLLSIFYALCGRDEELRFGSISGGDPPSCRYAALDVS